MFSAIIKRKAILSAFDEDALTSLVFDTLKYLPQEVLISFLETAKNLHDEFLKVPKAMPEFDYWPRFIAEPDWEGPACIPELVLTWNDFILVEESKWASGKSGEGLEEDDQAGEDGGSSKAARVQASEDRVKGKQLYDQLSREVLVAMRLAKQKNHPGNFALLYITDDLFLPEDEIRDSVDCLSCYCQHIVQDSITCRIYWSNWNNLANILLKYKGGIEAPFQELANILYEALGALGIELPFTGFSFAESSEYFKPICDLQNRISLFYNNDGGGLVEEEEMTNSIGKELLGAWNITTRTMQEVERLSDDFIKFIEKKLDKAKNLKRNDKDYVYVVYKEKHSLLPKKFIRILKLKSKENCNIISYLVLYLIFDKDECDQPLIYIASVDINNKLWDYYHSGISWEQYGQDFDIFSEEGKKHFEGRELPLPDGKPYKFRYEDKEGYLFNAVVYGHPLVDIKNRDYIKKMLIEPLFR